MKYSFGLIPFWLTLAFGQTFPECTRELARTDECADVINANACYNQNRFNNAQTLACIDGKDDADRKKKACTCCMCVGTQMCTWATKQKYC
ncbi:hypothetical protein K504DRAFT_504673 [Pleomassaria siparia CBS 279.74]|uniref:Secreted protein n=1 Tax=Pleomassaria siparia CBS 279.74 TaxID=1314801 RepID=A0A6G1K0Z9_9PLEO|nr:hypothetical protein K504DRAFT_504673 [Pleomassaria siparia CBS 279.74]